MKKAHIYFLLPLLGVLAFGGFYWRFSSGYEADLAQKAAVVKAAKEAKLAEDQRNREKAYMDAKENADRRKAEKAARDAKDAKDRDDRDIALAARVKARNDSDKLEGQVGRLKKDIEDTNKEIKIIEDDKRRSLAEEAFLKDFVKKAEANRAQLSTVLEKIAAADKAAEDAAKAAADAAKAKK
jgi:hypothetical protein